MEKYKLKYEEVTNDNLMLATKIQMNIFPNESAYKEFVDCINDDVIYNNYYLVYFNNSIIGITGLYNDKHLINSDSIFMGWFGVLPNYRRKGFGIQILYDTYKMALKYDKKYFRVFTSSIENPYVLPLYEKFFDYKEKYNNKNDYTFNNSCIIYSKLLNSCTYEKWNNKFLNIKKMIENEKIGNQLFDENNK